jgi:DNA primase
LRQRGLSEAIIEQFGIGYAPPGWDNLLQHLLRAGWQEAQLLDSGMLVDRDDTGRRYDRFRDRVMFPIRDVRGRVIAFGGRVLTDEKPKYLNSPETPVFSKGKELYGLYETSRSKQAPKRLVVVEGYMDVVALAQFGVTGAVATLGTAAGTAHLDKAFRYAGEVVFCFDGDEAGRRAAVRALDVSLPALRDQRHVRFLFLGEGDDPDSYVRRRGVDAFSALLDKATPLSEYLFEQASIGLQLDTAEGRAHLASRAVPQLLRLPEGPFKQQMFIDLSLRTQLDAAYLLQMGGDSASTETAESRVPAGTASEYSDARRVTVARRESIEPASSGRIALSLPASILHVLLHYPHLNAQALPFLSRLQQGEPVGELLWLVRLMELLRDNPDASRSRVLGLWHGQFGSDGSARLYELADQENIVGGELKAAEQLADALKRLLVVVEKENPLQRLIAQSRERPLTELEKHDLQRLLQEKHNPV